MSVVVKICSGTACYIMGGADLLSIENDLSSEEREKIKIEATNCLGECTDYGPQTPFAVVNGIVIPCATRQTLLEAIRQTLDEKEHSND